MTDRTDRAPDRETRCRAHIRTTGLRCNLDAVRGATVCHKHGAGRGSPARAAADRRVEAEAIGRQMSRATATYGLPVDVDPGQALLEEVQRAAGHVAYLSARVGALSERQLHAGGAPHPLLMSYRAERAHLAKVAADAVRCGLEARQIALMERQADLIVEAFRRFAGDLGHNPDDPRILGLASVRLRELTA